VNRGAERVLEAARGVGGEIDGQRRAIGHSPGDFDVEHDFRIRAGRCGGTVVRLVDQNSADRRRVQIKAFEILLEIGRSKTSAQLNDADCLPVAVRIRGEVVQRCHLKRRVCGG